MLVADAYNAWKTARTAKMRAARVAHKTQATAHAAAAAYWLACEVETAARAEAVRVANCVEHSQP